MAESNAVVHICNSALYRIGATPITSLDQGTTNANICREVYPDVRDTLLSWQSWPFATVRQSLVRLVATPTSDFSYYFVLPTIPAIIRVIDIDLTSRHIDYQREVYVDPGNPHAQQAVIATNASSAKMRYVGRTSEGLWSPLFVATLAVYLAQAIEPSISGKPALKQALLLELYGQGREPGLLAKLRDIVGYEDSPREIPMPSSYIDVRQGSWPAPTHYRW